MDQQPKLGTTGHTPVFRTILMDVNSTACGAGRWLSDTPAHHTAVVVVIEIVVSLLAAVGVFSPL